MKEKVRNKIKRYMAVLLAAVLVCVGFPERGVVRAQEEQKTEAQESAGTSESTGVAEIASPAVPRPEHTIKPKFTVKLECEGEHYTEGTPAEDIQVLIKSKLTQAQQDKVGEVDYYVYATAANAEPDTESPPTASPADTIMTQEQLEALDDAEWEWIGTDSFIKGIVQTGTSRLYFKGVSVQDDSKVQYISDKHPIVNLVSFEYSEVKTDVTASNGASYPLNKWSDGWIDIELSGGLEEEALKCYQYYRARSDDGTLEDVKEPDDHTVWKKVESNSLRVSDAGVWRY